MHGQTPSQGHIFLRAVHAQPSVGYENQQEATKPLLMLPFLSKEWKIKIVEVQSAGTNAITLTFFRQWLSRIMASKTEIIFQKTTPCLTGLHDPRIQMRQGAHKESSGT